jgi:serine/threonine protein kinase
VLWATEEVTGDKCAIKFFSRPNAKKVDRDRFISEAKTLRKLSHPHVVRCVAAGFVEISSTLVPCFAMPRARCSMADLITSKELRQDLPFTLHFFSALGQGIAYLHEQGIFHRDLKEDNIFVDDENLPWIADLGIARVPQSLSPDAAKTEAGERLRNALYSSPEQNITGSEVTRTTDIASFGYMLNHWLTDEPARPNALLPSDFLETQDIVALDAAIEQCIARNPEQRYQNMRACLSDLTVALGATCESKYRLGALGTARRQIRALSRGWPQPDLLSADNLRALYLGREKFSPDLKELRLLCGSCSPAVMEIIYG